VVGPERSTAPRRDDVASGEGRDRTPAAVQGVSPGRVYKNVLWLIHELARVDRHQTVHLFVEVHAGDFTVFEQVVRRGNVAGPNPAGARFITEPISLQDVVIGPGVVMVDSVGRRSRQRRTGTSCSTSDSAFPAPTGRSWCPSPSRLPCSTSSSTSCQRWRSCSADTDHRHPRRPRRRVRPRQDRLPGRRQQRPRRGLASHRSRAAVEPRTSLHVVVRDRRRAHRRDDHQPRACARSLGLYEQWLR
jgi:hypothetical protein